MIHTCPISDRDRRKYERWISRWRKVLAHKQDVAARHLPGSSYHTRAERDAESLRDAIARYERWLADGVRTYDEVL